MADPAKADLSLSFVKPPDARKPIAGILMLDFGDHVQSIDLTEHQVMHLLSGSVQSVEVRVQS